MKKMELITQRDLIRTVAERWRHQYADAVGDRAEIYRKLLALKVETATEADVDAIIGVGGWVTTWCDGCGKRCADVIRLGDEPDYDSATVHICKPCFDNAAKLWE